HPQSTLFPYTTLFRSESLRTYGRFLNLKMTVILGGVNQNTQIRNMSKGVDILVATPGRLLDLVQQKQVQLNAVNTFIVDEADRIDRKSTRLNSSHSQI